MARVVQCPNPSCGRTSQLGEDPLGRIFRCPRCLTKLPAEANAADSGWTNVLGPLPRRSSSPSSGGTLTPDSRTRPPVQNVLSRDRLPAQPIVARAVSTHLQSCDSGEFSVEPFDSQASDSWDVPFPPDLASQESGEVYVGPFGGEDRSEWNGTATYPGSPGSLADVRASRPSLQQSIGSLGGAIAKGIGPIDPLRDSGVLGEGHHATVYRAFDPFLERHVAPTAASWSHTDNASSGTILE